MTKPQEKMCADCGVRPVTRGHGAKYCDPCRNADQHRHRGRSKPVIIVMTDCEGKQVTTESGEVMNLWTASYGREDGTSGSVVTQNQGEALRWLLDNLTGEHEGQKQAVTAFHYNWDIAVLTRYFDPTVMELVHKSTARHRGLICGTRHKMGGRPCGKLHRYDPLDIQAVITDGGEGDVVAWCPKTELAVAATPRRRLYVEHRPFGDRMEKRRVLDVHDIGSAFYGNFESVLDSWLPPITDAQRDIIARGKAARESGFAGWSDDEVGAYSEAECVAGAMVARLLLATIKATAGVNIHPSKLFGSGSVAGQMNDFHRCPRRKDNHVDDMVDPLAVLTYFGGLIETPVIGRIRGRIKEDDINSAYTAHTSRLPCMRQGHGHWHHHKGNLDPEKAGEVGHVLAWWSVDTPSTPPFCVRLKSGAVRQPLNGSRVWVSMPEYKAAVRHFGTDVGSYAAWWWVQECSCPPPWAWLIDLYHARQQIKRDQKKTVRGSPEWQVLECRQLALKLILNSCYGKLAQRRPEPGKYTNLHYAAHITGSTRAADRERTWGLEAAGNMVIYQHTDSVLHMGPADLAYTDDLGGFKDEKQSEDMLIVQPGLVTAKVGKTATRGMSPKEFKFAGQRWADMVDFTTHPSTWPVLETGHRRMMSRRMAVARNKQHRAGVFFVHPLKLGIKTGKRDLAKAVPVPGEPEAWFVPPVFRVPPEWIATLDDIKAHQTAIQQRLRDGEFDGDPEPLKWEGEVDDFE